MTLARSLSAQNAAFAPTGRGQSDAPAPLRRHYRPDVDGLRALAVVSVVLFHAHLGGVTGGFVGVDIFFVISGYLISTIMKEELAAGQFSLGGFYKRRIRRIFPALFMLLGVCAVAGSLILLPADLEQFGRSILSASFFAANVFYWQNSGYFEGPAELKILLHLWSLAVEEQFYLLFPVALAIGWKWIGSRFVWLLAAAGLASFVLSLWALERNPSGAFYLAPFRAWELLLGALLALAALPQAKAQLVRDAESIVGLGLILYAIFALSDLSPFPGTNALFPCIGSALIIHAGARGPSLVGRALSVRPIVFIGLISYSLYLWHWPVFAFARYYAIGTLNSSHSVALVALSLLIAAASWHFVERPFRPKRDRLAPAGVFRSAALVTVAASVTGAAFLASDGWPARFNPQVNRISAYAATGSPLIDRCSGARSLGSSHCVIGDPDGTKLFLWGDSHAGALYGAFAALQPDGFTTFLAATPRCPPLIGIGTSRKCITRNWRKLKFLAEREDIETVVLAARWSVYFRGRSVGLGPAETNANLPYLQDSAGSGPPPLSPGQILLLQRGLGETVDRLLRMNKRVVLVYPVPTTGHDIPSTLARMASHDVDPTSFHLSEAAYLKRQAIAFETLNSVADDPDVSRVFPHQRLCRGGQCNVYMNGEPLYADSNHLTAAGARLLLPSLRAVLQRNVEAAAMQRRERAMRNPSEMYRRYPRPPSLGGSGPPGARAFINNG